jgi:hypothetical protein
MVEGLGRPIEALQAQGQGIARAHITGRDGYRTLQQSQRFFEFSLLLQPRGQHVEQQRMLEPACQRLFGQFSRPLKIAILGICQNRAERLHVSVEISGHRFQAYRISRGAADVGKSRVGVAL